MPEKRWEADVAWEAAREVAKELAKEDLWPMANEDRGNCLASAAHGAGGGFEGLGQFVGR